MPKNEHMGMRNLSLLVIPTFLSRKMTVQQVSFVSFTGYKAQTSNILFERQFVDICPD